MAGRGEPTNLRWGAGGYADPTTIFGRCWGANQQIVGAALALGSQRSPYSAAIATKASKPQG
jgi:hypothetical protein